MIRIGARSATRLAFLVAGFTTASWAPLIPMVKRQFGLADDRLGLLLLCAGLGSLGIMPVAGRLVARWGCRPAILAAGGGLVLLLPSLATADSLAMIALALLGFGASMGLIDVAMNVQAVEVERRAGTSLMSGFHAGFSLGGIAGAGGMTLLLVGGITPPVAASIEGVLAILALVIAAPGLSPFPENAPDSARGRATAATKQRIGRLRGIVLLYAALTAAAFLVEAAILDWGGVLISGMELVRPAQGGMGYVIFACAMTIGRLTGDRLVQAMGHRRLLSASGALALLGFVLLLASPWVWCALGGFALIGAGASNIVPILFSLAGRQVAMPAAFAITVLTIAGYGGMLAGPAAIGGLSRVFGLRGAFWGLAGLMALVSLTARRATRS